MADVFGMNIDVGGIASGAGGLMLTLLILGIIGALIAIVMMTMKYKHKFRVRLLTGGRIVEVDDKAKTVKTKEGIITWKLLKRKDRVPVPPSSAISVTNKGILSVTAYYTENGEYVYVDTTNKEGIGGEDPLNTTDREFYLNEVKKAEAEKGKGIGEWLMQMAPMLAVLIIFVMALSFWGSINEPFTTATGQMADATESMAKISMNQARTMQMINEIMLDKQGIAPFNMSDINPPSFDTDDGGGSE